MDPVLSLRGLTVRFGGLTAVDNLSFDLHRGQFVGLIGPNGAGKTTAIDAISGLVPSSGTVRLAGREISRVPAHRRAAAGLGRTFQSLELFEDLTVRENVLTAADTGTLWSPLLDLVRSRPSSRAAAAADRAMDFLALTDVADSFPPDLSLGRRKLVTIARALAGEPAVLLLDEPAAGLDSDESEQLGAELRTLIDRGITVLMVEHDMNLIHRVCDEVKVLEFGALISEGTPAHVSADPRVAEAYLGSADLVEAS